MADEYIKRKDAIGIVNGWREQLVPTYGTNDEYVLCLETVAEHLEGLPAADVVEVVRHGEWVDTQPQYKDWQASKNGMAYYCSVCKHNASKYKHNTYKYCPWCGAKMDGKEQDE